MLPSPPASAPRARHQVLAVVRGPPHPPRQIALEHAAGLSDQPLVGGHQEAAGATGRVVDSIPDFGASMLTIKATTERGV